MAKPIITLNGLKIVIMLGMLVIILSGDTSRVASKNFSAVMPVKC